ncbi:SMC domain protein [Solidesulfovibrio fructosivorans JJ]]|uniref:SMC domain protein n=1 Tax=Solidesulfovibrio fructosivorans JJ] TaxID=596151 RepID=E1JSD0_SOLFR|nr:AAA family ATPase [Solidesulfovibrio fructosivorans]EFL52899.1 SMC domain protein [Solidesulfovibrio fructosivorans JJ]]
MLIKRLEVKGFKSLKDVVWEPGSLTILIGPNGSGKSNILLALSFLQNIASGNLDNFIQENGGITRVAWDGSVRFIKVQLQSFFEIFALPTDTYYSLELALRNDTYRILKEICSEEYYDNDEKTNKLNTLIYREAGVSKITGSNGLSDIAVKIKNRLESFLSIATTPHQYDTSLYILKENIADTKIYRHLDTQSQANIRRPLITRFNKQIDSDGQNLVNVLHTLYSENRDFENDINTAMRAAFGDEFDRLVFPPAADQLVQLRIRWKSLKREQSMLDLSDGTIRFLFLMTVLCNPEPPSLIAIDEPETGLHPSMFPIIAEYAAEASKRTQVIFSTHSPQFLDAFSDCDVTTTVTSWENGETKIKNLDGEALKEWLTHYSLGTLFLSGDLEALA